MSASSFAGKPAKSDVAEISDYFFASADIKNVLPPAVQIPVDAATEREHILTEELEVKLKTSWDEVERLLELNQDRTKTLDSLDLSSLQGITFWTKESLSAHLGLDSFLDDQQSASGASASGDLASGGGGSQSGKSHPLNETGSMLAAPLQNRPRRRSRVVFKPKASGTCSTPGGSMGSSTTSAAGEGSLQPRPPQTPPSLLDADATAPLRRVFGPMLEKREILPKDLTILFASLDAVQKGDFHEMEESLQSCALKVSLHIPFAKIQQFISRNLCKNSVGAEVEAAYCAKANPLCRDIQSNYEAIRRLWSEEDTSSGTKTDATAAMWETLASELSRRRELNADVMTATSSCAEYEAKLQGELPALLQQCAEDVNAEFQLIQSDAKDAFAAANELYRKATAASETSSATYAAEKVKLVEGLKSSEYKCKHSQAQQEKMIRRIREAVKELRVEQGRHEVFMKDVLTQRVRLEQLDAAYEQFAAALKQRQDMMLEAHATCTTLNDVLAKAATTKDKILTECRFHVNRVLTEERLRCCRMIDRAAHNAQDWARVTNDITALFEARRDHVHKKSDDSWQLNYLLGQERTRTMANIDAIRIEYKKIESVWAAIAKEQERHELAVMSLEQREKDHACQLIRRVMLDLDDERGIARASMVVQELLFMDRDAPCRSLDAASRLLALHAARRGPAVQTALPQIKSSFLPMSSAAIATAPRPPPRQYASSK